LVPAFLLWLNQRQISVITVAPMAATTLLLAIGALYWRGKVRQLRGHGRDFTCLLRGIAVWQRPALVLTLLGCLTALGG
jgi:hypothetical protein